LQKGLHWVASRPSRAGLQRENKMGLSWMAWTWQTAVFFLSIAVFLVSMTFWELRVPGGNPRRGILALETTRGDRLFISLLGSAFIFLAWLGLLGPPLWGALAVSLIYTACVFRWV
jgi:predicted small integral membrane protein